MPKGTRIDEVEQALVARLTSALAADGIKTIRAITAADLDAEQDVIVTPPAVLVLFTSEPLETRRDHTRLTYQSAMQFLILCGASNLRGAEAERSGAHQLLNLADDALAGWRPEIPSSSQKPIVTLGRADLWQFDAQGTWYGRTVIVESVAQFAGSAG